MKSDIAVGVAILSIAASPCFAQSKSHTTADAPRPASERSALTAAREQALSSLDDPNPLVRAGAFEDVMASRDATLIDFALHKVLVGADQRLKGMALRTILSDPQRQFNFNITSCGTVSNRSHDSMVSLCDANVGRFAASVNLFFTSLDPSNGTFNIYSRYSMRNGGQYVSLPGKIQGSQVNFSVDLNSKIAGIDGSECVGQLALNVAGALAGTIICSDMSLTGAIDLY